MKHEKISFQKKKKKRTSRIKSKKNRLNMTIMGHQSSHPKIFDQLKSFIRKDKQDQIIARLLRTDRTIVLLRMMFQQNGHFLRYHHHHLLLQGLRPLRKGLEIMM
jgi:hypothetical protein